MMIPRIRAAMVTIRAIRSMMFSVKSNAIYWVEEIGSPRLTNKAMSEKSLKHKDLRERSILASQNLKRCCAKLQYKIEHLEDLSTQALTEAGKLNEILESIRDNTSLV